MMFFIGDIHGEITKLEKLVKNILQKDKKPSFIFIGDYIDKGENAKAAIAFLLSLAQDYDCTFLMGNHEYIWINLKEDDKLAHEYLTKYGGLNTIQSFNCSGKMETKEKMLELYSFFFEMLQSFAQYKNYSLVHSGIQPLYYETKLNDIAVKELLFNRYDFISTQSHYLGQQIVVFGHTGFYTPYYDGYKIGIDTAACFLEKQPLTAFNADEEYFINSDNTIISLQAIDKLSCPNILRNKPWRTVQYD